MTVNEILDGIKELYEYNTTMALFNEFSPEELEAFKVRQKSLSGAIKILSRHEEIRKEIKKNRDRDISGSPDTPEWLKGYRTGMNEALTTIDTRTEEALNELKDEYDRK